MEFRVLKAEWTVQNNDIPYGGANRRTHLFHVEKEEFVATTAKSLSHISQTTAE